MYIVGLQRELWYATHPTFIFPWDLGFCKTNLKLRGVPEASLRVRAIVCSLIMPLDSFCSSKCYFLFDFSELKISVTQIPKFSEDFPTVMKIWCVWGGMEPLSTFFNQIQFC
jgi:hypothetical protein